MHDEWTSHDAVLLSALANSGRRDLHSVIATWDAVNHDVPPFDIFASAASRLCAAGLITVERGATLRLTSKGRRLVRRRRGALTEQAGYLRDMLAAIPVESGPAVVDASAYDAALHAYLDC
jgi:hypothetical protein